MGGARPDYACHRAGRTLDPSDADVLLTQVRRYIVPGLKQDPAANDLTSTLIPAGLPAKANRMSRIGASTSTSLPDGEVASLAAN